VFLYADDCREFEQLALCRCEMSLNAVLCVPEKSFSASVIALTSTRQLPQDFGIGRRQDELKQVLPDEDSLDCQHRVSEFGPYTRSPGNRLPAEADLTNVSRLQSGERVLKYLIRNHS
jgi:hypothetical protein